MPEKVETAKGGPGATPTTRGSMPADAIPSGRSDDSRSPSSEFGCNRACTPGRVASVARMRTLPLAALALAVAVSGTAAAKTSHEGWPRINGDLKMHKNDQSGTLRATRLNKHNELLGGHGNDTIRAGNVGDVLWGDYQAGGQPTSQVDRIYGGKGKDFIYASHGTNFIHAGGGADQIHAHFGRGEIWCGGGDVTLFLSHKSRKRYRLHSCERISYATVGR